MTADERAIRDLVATWLDATAAGDIARIEPLMADDVVFLTPGNPPMRGRDAFVAAFAAGLQHMRLTASSEIQEILIAGGWATMWSRLTVTIAPHSGGPTKQRAGDVLTMLRRNPDGRWVIYRDANLLTAVESPAA